MCCLTLYSSTRLNDFAQLSFLTERNLTLSCYQLFIIILIWVTGWMQSPEIKSSLFCFPGSWLRIPRNLLFCKQSENNERANGAKPTLHNDRLSYSSSLYCIAKSKRLKRTGCSWTVLNGLRYIRPFREKKSKSATLSPNFGESDFNTSLLNRL